MYSFEFLLDFEPVCYGKYRALFFHHPEIMSIEVIRRSVRKGWAGIEKFFLFFKLFHIDTVVNVD